MAEQEKRPGFKYKVYEGMYFPPVPTEWLDELLHRFSPRDSDILLATYPRSGTTWLQNILYILKYKQKLDGNLSLKMPFLMFPQYQTREELIAKAPTLKDIALLKPEFESLPDPRILKTHLPWSIVPKNPNCKYIYCYRNPKDVLVSFYHHSNTVFGFERKFEEFFQMYMEGEVEFGNWFGHVMGWWEQRENKNFYFLSYEELQTNFKEKVQELAAFTGFGLTEEVFDLITQESSFSSMKSNQFVNMKPGGKPGEEHTHVRKGRVGEWREVLTPEQSKIIDQTVEEKLKYSSLRDHIVYELS